MTSSVVLGGLTDQIRKLDYFTRACGECISDIVETRHGVPNFYNIDFSLLCPILFNYPPVGSKEFLMPTKAGTWRIIEKAPSTEYYNLVISGITVIEFFDQLTHITRDFQRRIPVLRKRYGKSEDLRNLRDDWLKTSDQIRQELAIVTEKGMDERVREPADKFVELLDNNVVHAVGDVLDVNMLHQATDTGLFQRLFEEHKRQRLGFDRGRRPEEDSLFHYRMDAANTCFTLAASTEPGKNVFFLTPMGLNIRQCKLGDREFGRLDRTPLFLVNLANLKHSGLGQLDDEVEFLLDATRDALVLKGQLQRYNRIEDVPMYTRLKLAKFYEGPIGLLNIGSQEEDNTDAAEQLDEVLSTLSDETRMRTIVDQAMETARAGAKAVEGYSERLDLSYYELLNFEDDPVIARVRRQLGVKLR
jgi:hypothetical protein